MHSKVISISMPVNMINKIDEAAAAEYQSRSNFIRPAIVKQFNAHSQYELSREKEEQDFDNYLKELLKNR